MPNQWQGHMKYLNVFCAGDVCWNYAFYWDIRWEGAALSGFIPYDTGHGSLYAGVSI